MIDSTGLIKKVTSEDVAQSEIKRLSFTFNLLSDTNTLPDCLEAIQEVFHAFNRDRDSKLIPDCIEFKFVAYSSKKIDLVPLYEQLKSFLNPFEEKKWHTPTLLINTRHTFKREPFLTLELSWQDKTYEQYIKRPMPAFWESK